MDARTAEKVWNELVGIEKHASFYVKSDKAYIGAVNRMIEIAEDVSPMDVAYLIQLKKGKPDEKALRAHARTLQEEIAKKYFNLETYGIANL